MAWHKSKQGKSEAPQVHAKSALGPVLPSLQWVTGHCRGVVPPTSSGNNHDEWCRWRIGVLCSTSSPLVDATVKQKTRWLATQDFRSFHLGTVALTCSCLLLQLCKLRRASKSRLDCKQGQSHCTASVQHCANTRLESRARADITDATKMKIKKTAQCQ